MKPLCIDLFCVYLYIVAYGNMTNDGNQFRQGAVGSRVPQAKERWTTPARAWRKSLQAWADEMSRASVMAFHDDPLCLEWPRKA